ncbi:MAG: DUF4878 domain-containing protein [Bryobacteraceae bacterium]|nr:DUF4878 domain-containing protein [Bryobacteraceae bacterium]
MTLAVLATLAGVVALRQLGWRPAGERRGESSPQDVVYGMLEAARGGDVGRYLSYYSDELRTALKRAAAEASRNDFARYLRESHAPIKGIAITEPETLSADEASVRVEFVYKDRTEAQTMRLRRIGGVWRIAQLDPAARAETVVPYGAPVQ